MAEYTALVTNSAIIATLWFGGPDGPRIASNSIGPVWFVLKTLIILFVYVWIRATLPRLRYDQLMDLGWKVLIPASLAMLMVVAGFQVSRRRGGWLAFSANGAWPPSWAPCCSGRCSHVSSAWAARPTEGGGRPGQPAGVPGA